MNAKWLLAIAFVPMLAVSGLLAAPPAIEGKLDCPPYRLVRLTAAGTPDKAGLRWKVKALDAKAAADLIDWATPQNGPKAEFVAPPGRYAVTLTAVTGSPDAGYAIDEAEAVVTVGGGVPVPPGPGPVPPVVDTLQETVQSIYGSLPSPTNKADRVALAAVYRACKDAAGGADVKTAGDLFKVVKLATEGRIGGRLKPVREVFGGELGKVLPADPGAELTADHRAAAVKQFDRFAAALDALTEPQ